MAHLLEPDSIDFAAYEQATECKVKVRRAGQFAAGIKAEFAVKPDHATQATMRSTKLRGRIEFRPGEVTVWTGYNGHRKSMLTGQLVLDLVAGGRKVLVASLEMQPERTLARMARQACAKRFPTPAEVDAFARWTDGRLWVFDHVGRITPALCTAVCRYFSEELGGEHVFVDSMMMVCTSEESLDEQKQFVTDLCRLAQETALHVHLVTHCRKPHQEGEARAPSKYDIRGAAAISDQAANVATIWANRAKREALERNPHDAEALGKPDALVGIEKQRNGAWEGRIHLWFDEATLRFCDSATERVEAYEMGASV